MYFVNAMGEGVRVLFSAASVLINALIYFTSLFFVDVLSYTHREASVEYGSGVRNIFRSVCFDKLT